jgi:D-alanine-D-alanine ligase
MAARDEKELKRALENAFRYTDRVIAEPYLENKRELECGYFSVKGKELFTNAGEILSNGSFYDYESKYGGGTRTATVADILPEINKKIKEYSARLVSALGVRHLSRIDFFLSGDSLYFNEINTMPGFTAESLYPRMLTEAGIPTGRLIDLFIEDTI